jgi:hypothetical protein
MKPGFGVEKSNMNARLLKSFSAFLIIAAAGCQGTVVPGALTDAFVKVDRTLSAETQSAIRTMAVPTGNDQSFYIAVNKSELGQRYFMSAFMKQFFPGATAGGAGYPLGTKVVTFRVQNGKLFVFDASDLNKTSDQFDPTLIVEAYPIVTDNTSFNNTPGSKNYVLFDPAAGLNKYGFVESMFDSNEFYGATTDFQVDVAYSQNFRSTSDGAIWDEVFTGSTSDAVQLNDGSQASTFKASGTLGLALRKYKETPSYTALPYPDKPFYWTSEPKLVPNTGGQGVTINANHWAVGKGKPIHWVLDPRILEVQKQYPQYDLVGALKRGITNWNQVFGFEALTVSIATPNESWGDDNTAYVLWDPSPVGIAWATEVANPNTGEIRNAWIYFSSFWLDDALGLPPLINGAAVATAKPVAKHAKIPGLTWSTYTHAPNCVRFAGDSPTAMKREALAQAASNALTDKQIVENLLTHVLLHEVGHTLGLRHNFKGSLDATKSTSVMDYIFDDEAVTQGLDFPSGYDTDAIKYLYGMSTTPPAQAFGTDEDTRVDPYTQPYDPTGLDPLNQYYGPVYRFYANRYLNTPSDNSGIVQYIAGDLFDYVRASNAYATSTARKQAFDYAFFSVKVGGAPAAADPARVNELSQLAFSQIYGAGSGDIAGPATPDAVVTPAALTQVQGNLDNTDHLRAAATRRMTVDILKGLQSEDAYSVLLDAQPKLNTELTALSGTAANDLKDLIARVQAAVSPYFN